MSCSCMLQRGQNGVVWFDALTLCRHDVRKGDLFVVRCAKVRRCALVSVVSVVFIVGPAACSLLIMIYVDYFVCFACCVFDGVG